MPNHCLEYFVKNISTASSQASADYVIEDYNSTEFEVVLETLFDDDRIQLTEKILRPIALGQPFILTSTHGSLEYLRSYGFKTFASVIDETYDTIENPVERLETIVKVMKEMTNWSNEEREAKMAIANQIATYNRKHFFNSKFIDYVTEELQINLKAGLDELEKTNTSSIFINRRKLFSTYTEIKQYITSYCSRQTLVEILSKARQYYKRSLSK